MDNDYESNFEIKMEDPIRVPIHGTVKFPRQPLTEQEKKTLFQEVFRRCIEIYLKKMGRFKGKTESWDDLTQEALMGLLEFLIKFDKSKLTHGDLNSSFVGVWSTIIDKHVQKSIMKNAQRNRQIANRAVDYIY